MKARWFTIIALLSLHLALFPRFKPWYSQYNFAYGSKAMALGNAFAAVADDLTAAFWNPAGLAAIRIPEFYLSLKSESQSFAYEPQSRPVTGDTRLYNYDFNSQLQQIDFFSVSAPAEFWKAKWSFALSYYRYIPYGFKGSAQGVLSSQNNRFSPQKTSVNFSGSEGVDVLAFSTAVAISEYFALGCTLQQFFSSGSQHLQTSADPNREFNEQFSEKLQGRNFIFGLLFRPYKILNLGFTYHSGLKSRFDSSLLTWETIAGTTKTSLQQSCVAEVSIPRQMALGIALQPARWLTLAFETSRIDWSKGAIAGFYGNKEILPYPEKSDFSLAQKNVRNIRAGAEVSIPLHKWLIHLRGGWFSEQQLFTDYLGQAVKSAGFAIGAGWEISAYLLLEFAFQRHHADWNEKGYFSKPPDVTAHYHGRMFNFSLTYRFGKIFKEQSQARKALFLVKSG